MALEQAMENPNLEGESRKYEGSPIEVYIQILKDMNKEIPEGKTKKTLKYVYFQNCDSNDNISGEKAIYQAICSGNTKNLDKLINECHLFSSPAVLNSILSLAYCRIKLNNVLLSEEMDLCIQYKLVKLRFYSQDIVAVPTPVSDIEERLCLVLEKIDVLLQYSALGVNETFLYLTKFIAKNLYILKQQLKTTYVIFPWEEIVFCLCCFVSAHTKMQELNVFYWYVLTKESILKKVKTFSDLLKDWIGPEKKIFIHEVGKQRGTREDVVAGILKNNPQFKDLYEDYTELRDVYSLDMMFNYINAALLADCRTREGQLTIKRALQVMGEELKNTLESPNLSSVVSDLLLLSAPLETRQILTGIRNSLSHAHILKDSEGYEKLAFYTNVHNDLKKIYVVISQILGLKKINKIKSVLASVKNSKSFDEVSEIMDNFKYMSILDPVKISQADILTGEEKHMEEIVNLIPRKVDLSEYEKDLFNEIKQLFDQTKNVFTNVQKYYSVGFGYLKTIFHPALKSEGKTVEERAKFLKIYKRTSSEMLLKLPEVSLSLIESFNDLSEMLKRLYESVEQRVAPLVADDIQLLIYYIHGISVCDKKKIKWIDEFKECLGKHKLKKAPEEVNSGKGKREGKGKGKEIKEMLETNKEEADEAISKPETNKEEVDEVILEKLSELRDILNTDSKELLKADNTKRFMVEALFLDVLSDLDTIKYLVGNILFVDDGAPLLTGKCLRNYLAHGNPLVDTFFPDSFTVVFTNAKILTESPLAGKKLGQMVRYNGKKLKENYERGLDVIHKQEELHKSLQEGNLNELKRCLEDGADTNYRSQDLQTVLHLAAQGPSLEILKFLIDEEHLDSHVRECFFQSPLHVASAFGRDSNVEYLAQEVGLSVNDEDGSARRPLHLAAQQGHKNSTEILLRLGAEKKFKDWCGHAPLHYAIRYNHLNVVQVLADQTVNYRESSDGFSPLHIASDFGHAEIVEYLLDEGAEINDKAYTGATPLYFAALNGHLETVRILISKGANINAKGLYSGNTPINNAAEEGHEDVVELILTHNASVNIGNRTLNQTPIQVASFYGHKGIVQLLIKHKADVNAVRYDGLTCLMGAALNGHKDIVDLLILNGAKLDLCTFDGSTALHLSARRGHNGVVKSLLEAKVDMDLTNEGDLTALHEAARSGNLEVVKMLTATGCNVDARALGGFTPLHITAIKRHVHISEALLSAGASVDPITEGDFSTPLNESVRKANNEDTIRLLLANGANVESECKSGFTPLLTACFFGRCGAVKILIENKANIDCVDENGYSPVHFAVAGNHKTVVEVLLNNGASIQNDAKHSILCRAVRNNNKEMVELLLASGADINVKGGSPLLTACSDGHRSAVEVLLKHKNINVHVTNDKGQTPLHLAAIGNFWNIGKALLKKGVAVDAMDSEGQTPLLIAIYLGRKEFIQVLLDNGVDLYTNINQLISLAIMNGHPVILDKLLKLAASKVDVQSISLPFIIAVKTGNFEMVKVLLKHLDIDINEKIHKLTRNNTLLHEAANSGHVEFVRYFISKGADLHAEDRGGSKPLHVAAKNSHDKVIDVFLEHGMSINEKDKHGNTPLHHSLTVDMTRHLLNKCADVHISNNMLQLPIHTAAERGLEGIVSILLEHGSEFNSKDLSGKTPRDLTTKECVIRLLDYVEQLFKAVEENNIVAVENLIKKERISVNARKTDNWCLIHIATKNGFVKVCEVLLMNQADSNAIGNKGNAPLHYAAEFSHFEIVKLLLSHGAVYNLKSENGKTPLQVSVQQKIKDLLRFVEESFRKVQIGDLEVIEDFRSLNDIKTVRAAMKACNEERKILVNVAIQNNFPQVEDLQLILQEGLSNIPNLVAKQMISEECFTKANFLLNMELTVKEAVLGKDNPNTLDSQFMVANTLVKQFKYSEALKMLNEVLLKQSEGLKCSNQASLRTESQIGFVLHKQGNHQLALENLQKLYKRQKEILTNNHRDLFETSEQNCIDVEISSKIYRSHGREYRQLRSVFRNVRNGRFIDFRNPQHNRKPTILSE